MTRDEAIKIIESFYPADASQGTTRAIGRKLLTQAKKELGVSDPTWRDEDEQILIRYAELCQEEVFRIGKEK